MFGDDSIHNQLAIKVQSLDKGQPQHETHARCLHLHMLQGIAGVFVVYRQGAFGQQPDMWTQIWPAAACIASYRRNFGFDA